MSDYMGATSMQNELNQLSRVPAELRGPKEPLLAWLTLLLEPGSPPGPESLTVLREEGLPPLAVSVERSGEHTGLEHRALIVGGAALEGEGGREGMLRFAVHYSPSTSDTLPGDCSRSACHVLGVDMERATMQELYKPEGRIVLLDPDNAEDATFRADLARTARLAVNEHLSSKDPVQHPGALALFMEMAEHHDFGAGVVERVQAAAAEAQR